LIVSRVLIGVGTSAGYPASMVLIRRRAESVGLSEPPSRVLAGLQIAGTVTATVGLPIGGLLVAALGWRATFLVNIPVTAVCLAALLRWIPADRPRGDEQSLGVVIRRLDIIGIVGFAASMTALLVCLGSLPRWNWVAFALAPMLGAGLIAWEARTRQPFLDVRMLASNLALTRTYVRFALSSLCIYTVLYGISEWLVASRGVSAAEAGLLVLPMTAVSAVVAHLISKRYWIRVPLLIAAGSSLAGSVATLLLTVSTPTIWVVVITAVFGVTFGATVIGNQTALYAHVKAAEIGVAAGIFRTSGYVGSIASAALITAVFQGGVNDHGLHMAAEAMVAVSAVTLLASVIERKIT